jgi:NAD(P)-dependent dehydrogenase (short-subunit alcohol dehydrogenase family)
MAEHIRRVLVTGGSRGIGRAVVERLAEDSYDVVATARGAGSLDVLEVDAATRGWSVSAAECDVADERSVARLVEERGPFDLVVANAGLASAAPLHRTTVADLEAALAVNTLGVFHVLRATVPVMQERGFGRAVVVASTAGVTGAPYTSAYTASKHAAVGLVRAIASEVAGTDVTVNAVCPTYVDTEMTATTIARIADRTGRTHDEARASLLERVPLGRLVRPAEVAAAVAYLCSESAAPVNGQTLILDGGGS